MKTIKYLGITAIVMIALFIGSCTKDENKNETKDLAAEVAGTYKGSLVEIGQPGSVEATAIVTKTEINTVDIHCYSSDFDTTFMMELFENGDSMMVCNFGDDFIMHYGHARMNDHHNMMGDPDWQNWNHHLSEEHQAGDEHFGGFDRMEHNFGCRFVINSDSTLQFNGIRQ